MSNKKLSDKNEMIYNDTGFGVESISIETINKNIDVIKHIAEQSKRTGKDIFFEKLTAIEKSKLIEFAHSWMNSEMAGYTESEQRLLDKLNKYFK